MATAQEVGRRALKRILVEGDEAPLESTEYADYYDVLNAFMSDLEAKNINLGFTPVTTGTDEVTVPDGALRGIIANTAIEASPDYGGYVSAALQNQAREGMRTLRKLGRVSIQVKYPETLPRGSGNDDQSSTYWNYHFYGFQDSALVSLSGNTSATTIAVANTKVRVNGFWNREAAKGYLADADGRILNDSGASIDAEIKVSNLVAKVAAGTDNCTFTILRNGHDALKTFTVSLTTTESAAQNFSVLDTLHPGDFIDLFVENDDTTENITVVDCQMKVI